MATKSQPESHADPQFQAEAPSSSGMFAEVRARSCEAASALAEANQRVVSELIELSSAAARETLRTWSELGSAAVEAARSAPVVTLDPRESAERFTRDPLAWYRKALLPDAEGPQRVWKLFEANAQIVTRSAQRFQTSAERSGKEIQGAVSAYMSRMQEIYGGR